MVLRISAVSLHIWLAADFPLWVETTNKAFQEPLLRHLGRGSLVLRNAYIRAGLWDMDRQ